MKIVISPSKTKSLQGSPTGPLLCAPLTRAIVSYIKDLPVATWAKAMKLTEDKAEALQQFYTSFDKAPVGAAALSYTGLAFKNLNWQGLSDKGKVFGQQHLRIFSGLYGLLTPESPIKAYRLDFENSIFKDCSSEMWQALAALSNQPIAKKQLSELWKNHINQALKDEDVIINLASKEYSVILDHPRVITIIFEEEKNGKWKQGSTISKQMRGQFVHYLLENEIRTIEELPTEFLGFVKAMLPDESNVLSYRRKG